jgi:hypothetical protein
MPFNEFVGLDVLLEYDSVEDKIDDTDRKEQDKPEYEPKPASQEL